MVTKSGNDRLKGAHKERAGHFLGAAADAVILVAVLCFSAVAIVALALAAPVALAVSAIAGLFVTKRGREAHAG